MFGSQARAVRRRQAFVATYQFPHSLGHDVSVAYPHLMSLEPAFLGLRQWLRLHVAEPELLGMPSRAVDLLWHEFILHTVFYKEFCLGAYGRDLHHSPERSMNGQQAQVMNGEGMARTFGMACADDHISDPKLGLPTLFTVDATLGLTDGQLWTFDCGTATCSAVAPWRCVRHQVLPFAPRRLPQQLDLGTNRWTQDTFNPWLFAQANELHNMAPSGAGHSHGGQPETGHSCGGSSHQGHAQSSSPDAVVHEGASQSGGESGHHSDTANSVGLTDGGTNSGFVDSGSSTGGSDSGSPGGGSDSGSSGGSDSGSSCGGSSCGGSSCGGST